MRFTERDGRLLHWITGHGFVTLRQVARWLGMNYQTAQRRVRLLFDHGYLDRQWLVHGDRAHWLTSAGRATCGNSLLNAETVQRPPLGWKRLVSEDLPKS